MGAPTPMRSSEAAEVDADEEDGEEGVAEDMKFKKGFGKSEGPQRTQSYDTEVTETSKRAWV